MFLTVFSVFLRGLESIRVCDTFFISFLNEFSNVLKGVFRRVLGYVLNVKTAPETIRALVPF